jgi:hypothetical protein
MAVHIITECYVDTLFVETIIPTDKGYNHQHACTKVLHTMKQKLADVPVIGIIDDDKVEPTGMHDFDPVITYKDALKLYKHKRSAHYIIKICPAMEQFILTAAQQCNISPATCNVPSEINELRKITKHETSKNNKDLKNLILALKPHSENICALIRWVECIKTNPYNPKIDAVQK